MSAVDRAEKTRRESIRDHHAQMLDAQAQCVPCKLCGGQAVISDAGEGWGYNIACAAYGEHLRKVKCTQGGIRLSGWAYNVSDLWNRLNAAPVSAGKVKALIERLLKQAEQFGYVLSDPPAHRELLRDAATALSTQQAERSVDDVDKADAWDAITAKNARIVALEAEIAGLRALQPGDGWQGIESAPRDGQTVLLHGLLHYPSIDAGSPETVMAHWTEYNGGGWVWHGSAAITFTHWMPLPAPPSALSQEGEA